jgi:excinuclease ABC subunit C
VIQTKTIEAESHMEEKPSEILGFSVAQMRATFKSDAPEIIVPFSIDYPLPGIRITVPKGGDRKKLLVLSEKNVTHFIAELKNRERLQLNKGHAGAGKLLGQVQVDLKLPLVPRHIECFDNSNFQGSYPVSAMVCFKDGLPSKKDYRHFNVKTVKGIDDFATMKEAVYRRYKRLKMEDQAFPQLVIIDGGKGQLGAAREAINELGLGGKLTLVGLAKNEEEIFFSGDRDSLKLPLNSPSLKFIRRIRDEVHRFGISFHRNKRSRGLFKNKLEEIPGIGQATADLLLKTFKSVKNIRSKSISELSELIGRSKAEVILRHLN